MKRISSWVVVGGLILMMAGQAEAGVGKWAKNSVIYLYRPIPALWNYGTGLVSCAVDKTLVFVKEVVGNLNANPATLAPGIPPPVPQPGN